MFNSIFKLKIKHRSQTDTLRYICFITVIRLTIYKPHTLLSISHITRRRGKQCATDAFYDENGVDSGWTLVVIGR